MSGDGHLVQMRWGDLDPLGHVSHTAALVLLEAGRDAFLRDHGIGREEYVVGRCTVEYRREIEPSLDRVRVRCAVSEVGGSSLTTAEQILDPGGEVLVDARFGLVLWDPSGRAPRAVTARERAALGGEREEER